MDTIVFLVFRRMRAPLLSLILVYAVAMAGLALIPAQDAAGEPATMSLFHAFYFVSYMSTTIGFGELPNTFTDAQRLWVSGCVFATVAVWIYAIGTLIALLQDATFQRAIRERRFRARVRGLCTPFYLVCGYGQTGSALVRGLTDRHLHAVVVDIDPERINLLQLENQREYVPAFCADARSPAHLEAAGLRHPLCQGVVALTNVNETNLKIAIAAKLMHPEVTVICRADSHEVEANMASFGTDHIYDPFDTFALYMATAIQAPCLTLLFDWLSGFGGERLKEPLFPPTRGRWVICGYGRFGKAMYKHLKEQGMEVQVIEALPHKTGIPEEGVVQGRGTEAVTLEQAGIRRAVGLVAGTDHDADNLSIVMTALMLNRGLFVIARENQHHNHQLFARVGAHAIMHPSLIVANRIGIRLVNPLLSDFATLARLEDEPWACELVSRVLGLVGECAPHVWEIVLEPGRAFAVCDAIARGEPPTLEILLRDPQARDERLPVIPLLLARDGARWLLPGPETELEAGDRLLCCGREWASRRMGWTLQNLHALDYVCGRESWREGPVWQLLAPLLRRARDH
ncbi:MULTISPECIES: TrkA family potassium uptake protein [Marichromatium]|uniref:Trk K+ transport system NAD-binding subunit n=1 Tax=Marichromatium gracile TaxID=1048 RepID=A0A4R4AHA8_MARGR|nr:MULTISPECIES: NAD-binding protein [Marichromatium]MBO8087674.1 NAD-binding protein [Marichromatium sp.]MBK1710600.1 potassium transporter TrkA [Marichromatium gracile]RNE89118.1 potassium channel protein [Marichromatium sp. AB31]RNE91404.1 potassium channel protein [Marichromatium sp. AB32]TCW38139.1 Trk K+ transport system NAD-binding subunit [Marichromatium gracile]